MRLRCGTAQQRQHGGKAQTELGGMAGSIAIRGMRVYSRGTSRRSSRKGPHHAQRSSRLAFPAVRAGDGGEIRAHRSGSRRGRHHPGSGGRRRAVGERARPHVDRRCAAAGVTQRLRRTGARQPSLAAAGARPGSRGDPWRGCADADQGGQPRACPCLRRDRRGTGERARTDRREAFSSLCWWKPPLGSSASRRSRSRIHAWWR